MYTYSFDKGVIALFDNQMDKQIENQMEATA